jgi:hypothetical protein
MHTLPTTMIRLLEPFAPLFSKRVFQHVLKCSWQAPTSLLDAEPSALPCAQWAWTNTSDSIVTTECSAVPAGRVLRPVACC